MIIQFQPHLHSVTPLLRDSKHMGSLAVYQGTLMYFCSPHYNPKDIRLPGFKTVCFYHSSPATHIPQKPLERRCSKPVHREKQLWSVSWSLAGSTVRSLQWWTHWCLLSSRNGQSGNWSIKQPLSIIALLQVIFYSSRRKLCLNHLLLACS